MNREPDFTVEGVERELLATAAHETGHEIVAVNLGLETRLFIGGAGNGVLCHAPTNPLKRAAISFGGVLAEDLLGLRHGWRTLPRVVLSAESLPFWCEEIASVEGARFLSSQDWSGISGAFCQRQLACRVAFDILSARLDALRWLTEQHAKAAQEQVAGRSSAEARGRVDQFAEAWRNEVQRREYERRERELLANYVPSPPDGFPAKTDQFISIIIAGHKRGQPLTLEAAVEASKTGAEFAGWLRQTGVIAWFLDCEITSRESWRYYAGKFQDYKHHLERIAKWTK